MGTLFHHIYRHTSYTHMDGEATRGTYLGLPAPGGRTQAAWPSGLGLYPLEHYELARVELPEGPDGDSIRQ